MAASIRGPAKLHINIQTQPQEPPQEIYKMSSLLGIRIMTIMILPINLCVGLQFCSHYKAKNDRGGESVMFCKDKTMGVEALLKKGKE